MKTATKTVTAFLGALCMLALVGCPKKSVLQPSASETKATPDKPIGQDQLGGYRWNLRTVCFDFDKSDIRTGDAAALRGNCDQIRAAAAQNQKPGITIEGYCDPVGTAEYNMALGMRRAEATEAYLVRLGADANQLTTISYGEEKLLTQDEMQFELNRRCEFRVAK
jgi:peptidoglycan-associated lipoprotein